ncbi:hypothetical protein ACFLTE_02870 [Bacteroidota bacterium]
MNAKFNYTKGARVLFLIILVAIFLTSCADVIPVADCINEPIYGFWRGLMHGIISPFTFIISLFTDDVAIYAINNNGNWYNFGFMFGVAIIFGSGGNASKKRKK